MEEREGQGGAGGAGCAAWAADVHTQLGSCAVTGDTRLLGFSLNLPDMEGSSSPLVTWVVSKITSQQL